MLHKYVSKIILHRSLFSLTTFVVKERLLVSSENTFRFSICYKTNIYAFHTVEIYPEPKYVKRRQTKDV